MINFRILAINPGSTSTKIAIYDDGKEVFETTLRHPESEINKFEKTFYHLNLGCSRKHCISTKRLSIGSHRAYVDYC